MLNFSFLKKIFILFSAITITSVIMLATTGENQYVYLDKLKRTNLPPAVYLKEKGYDLFDHPSFPAKGFTVIRYDLNNDGNKELFVSNPDNNGAFIYFWRIYNQSGKSFERIGEMGCTSLRITSEISDNYMDLDCYVYRSMAEGYFSKYKHFGSQYFIESKEKIKSKDYYCDHPDSK